MEFNHWLWLSLAVVLFVIELFLPGISFMWLGAAAAITAIGVWLLPMSWAAQCILFSVLVIISLIVWWRFFRVANAEQNGLNNPTLRYVGHVYPLIQAIENGRGKIQIGDTQWLVEGENLPVGTSVEIVSLDGLCFKVKAAKQ